VLGPFGKLSDCRSQLSQVHIPQNTADWFAIQGWCSLRDPTPRLPGLFRELA
jgi:hypothetical protein